VPPPRFYLPVIATPGVATRPEQATGVRTAEACSRSPTAASRRRGQVLN